MIQVGHEVVETVLLDAEAVKAFGDSVQDHNPIHFVAVFAAGTRFGKAIVHGTFLVGLIGRIMGMRLPGPGTIYLEHHLRFRKAVPVGTTVRLRVAVLEALPRDRLRLRTDALADDGTTYMEGEALVWLPGAVA